MMDKDAVTGVIVDAAIRIHQAFGLAFPSVRMTESFVRCCLVGVETAQLHCRRFISCKKRKRVLTGGGLDKLE